MIFEVGLWYENNLGKYKVLAIQGDNIEVQYSDGRQQVLSVKVQMRIQENKIRRESSQQGQLSGKRFGKRKLYRRIGSRAYWTVGFLLSRLAWLGANLTDDKSDNFKRDYYDIKGIELSPNQEGISYLRSGANQWGNQGVIRFNAKAEELNLLEFSSDNNTPYPTNTDNIYEVKDIKFLMFLLENGFELRSKQNVEDIMQNIPDTYKEFFNKGYLYAQR